MYYHPRKGLANEDRIFKQRQYENALQDKLNFVHKYESLMRYAQFEQLHEPKTSHRTLAEKLEAIRAHREHILFERRKKLSTLLESEENTLRDEIKTGTMNLSERRAWLKAQALTQSVQKHECGHACVETNLTKALRENSDEVSMHNSKLAIMRAEAERKRQRDDENMQRMLQQKDLDVNLGLECNESHGEAHDEHAVDILRRHLDMVQRLREEEKAAVEEDMINMNRRWLEEEETLKFKQFEQRHHHSLQAKELLLCNEDKRGDKEDYDSHMVAMVAEREAGEEKKLEELKDAHKKEAMAYIDQLKVAVERQRFEDEELEEMIKVEMDEEWHKGQPQFRGTSQRAQEEEEEEGKTANDAKLSKKDLVDILESQIRGLHAAELVDQEVKRVALQGDKDTKKTRDIRAKQTLADLPYPEPYYGRKAVKWYE